MDWLTIVCGIVLIVTGVARLIVENTGRLPAATGFRRLFPYVVIVLGVLFIAIELLASAST
ncbi:MAG: hypothetical protein M3440_09200 [Chloroflexota bacterium]|nr:hypothetical protein [Chloroflexota bacterium]